jgi:adenylate kinase family enzyme
MRIAIIGPDGAGKTSTAKQVQRMVEKSRYQYSGKNSGHILKISKRVAEKHDQIHGKSASLSLIYKYSIFYVFEYIENVLRFKNRSQELVIFDRHPIDRVVLLTEKCYRLKKGTPDPWEYLDVFMRMLWSNLYLVLFYRIDHIFLLVPAESVIFDRSNGQYISTQEARIKRLIYIKVLRKYGITFANSNVVLESHLKDSVSDVATKIVSQL